MEGKTYILQINVIHRLCAQKIRKKEKEMEKANNNVSA